MENFQRLLDSQVCVPYEYLGLMTKTESSDGVEYKKISSFNNYTPLAYEGRSIVFFVSEDSFPLDSQRYGLTPIDVVLVTPDPNIILPFLNSFDSYDHKDVKVNMSYLDNYLRFFKSNENKPFQDICVVVSTTMRFDIKDYLSK